MNKIRNNKQIYFLRFFTCFLAALFTVSSLGLFAPKDLSAQVLLTRSLPFEASMVHLTPAYTPVMINGINLYPNNPLKFDFIVGKGDLPLADAALEDESAKLIKYFMAALTVPEDQMWVNLSPYERHRIIPHGFGKTQMGQDLLAQDYLLKQLISSLTHPEGDLGKKFWNRVYKKAYEQLGTIEIPMNTFNKIWIVPQKATIYEHRQGAVVISRHLDVMLEEDYLALEINSQSDQHGLGDIKKDDLKVISGVSSLVVKEILIPEIEREVNEGKIFANLRQIYNSVILAAWYKQTLRNSLLSHVYVNQGKVRGVDVKNPQENKNIYDQYVESFKAGVYSHIKEDFDPKAQEVVLRKYFSGGANIGENIIGIINENLVKEGNVDSQQRQKEIDKAITASQDNAIITAVAQPIGIEAEESWPLGAVRWHIDEDDQEIQVKIEMNTNEPAHLHWGINNWEMPPEDIQPQGTNIIHDKENNAIAAQTPMSHREDRQDKRHALTLFIPSNINVETINFVIYYPSRSTDNWDDNQGRNYSIPVNDNIRPALELSLSDQRKEVVSYLRTGNITQDVMQRLLDSQDFSVVLALLNGMSYYQQALPEGSLDHVLSRWGKLNSFYAGLVEALEIIPGQQAAKITAQLKETKTYRDAKKIKDAGNQNQLNTATFMPARRSSKQKKWLLSQQYWKATPFPEELRLRAQAYQEMSDRLSERFGERFVGLNIFGSMYHGSLTKESDADMIFIQNQISMYTESDFFLEIVKMTDVPAQYRSDIDESWSDPSLGQGRGLFSGLFFGNRDRLEEVQRKVLLKSNASEWNEMLELLLSFDFSLDKLFKRFDIRDPREKNFIKAHRILYSLPYPYQDMREILDINSLDLNDFVHFEGGDDATPIEYEIPTLKDLPLADQFKFARHGIVSKDDGGIDFSNVPLKTPWVMDEIRSVEGGDIVKNWQALPLVRVSSPVVKLPVGNIHGMNNEYILLGLAEIDGIEQPVVLKIWGWYREPKFDELVAAQVYDQLGVAPKFYGIIVNENLELQGYAMQLVIGQYTNIEFDEDILHSQMAEEISQRIFSLGFGGADDRMKTRTGNLVAIDPFNRWVGEAEEMKVFMTADKETRLRLLEESRDIYHLRNYFWGNEFPPKMIGPDNGSEVVLGEDRKITMTIGLSHPHINDFTPLFKQNIIKAYIRYKTNISDWSEGDDDLFVFPENITKVSGMDQYHVTVQLPEGSMDEISFTLRLHFSLWGNEKWFVNESPDNNWNLSILKSGNDEIGGIDLNPNSIEMNVEQGDGIGFHFPTPTSAQIKEFQHVQGFTPLIINRENTFHTNYLHK